MIQFKLNGHLFRTNTDATLVQRYEPATQEWTAASGVAVRSRALLAIAKTPKDQKAIASRQK